MSGKVHYSVGESQKKDSPHVSLGGADVSGLVGQISGSVYRFDLGQGDVMDIETLKQSTKPSSRKDVLLLRAILEGRYRAVKWLLREGADPNIRNVFGLPVLMTAIARQQADVVRLLLDAGADTQVQHGGFTPLIYAQISQHEAIIRMIERQKNVRNL